MSSSSENREETVSTALRGLVKILRHGQPSMSLEAAITHINDALVKANEEPTYTVEDLESRLNDIAQRAAQPGSKDKVRLEIRDDTLVSPSGHSIATNEDHFVQLSDDVREAVHLTHKKAVTSIMLSGLHPGGKAGKKHREHVHMCPPDNTSLAGSKEKVSNVKLTVDVAAARAAGIEFVASTQGVILCASVIPPEFITKVEDLVDGAWVVRSK